MIIPFLDLKSQYAELQMELDSAYRKVMESGEYILGSELEAFEGEFARYCGVKHCIGIGNGLDALYLTLRAWGIGPGDQVIVPANTYIATWLAVTRTGAKPVPVEPDFRTYNIDTSKILAAITPKTKAIIAVHLYGQPADMNPLRAITEDRDIRLLEDSAQAHGARYHHTCTGNLGDAAGFSFYPSKNLGAFGDGGAVTTNDGDLNDKLRILRNYGSRMKYYHEIPGFNSRLDELQAAFLRVKLRYLDTWNKKRKNIAEIYLKCLQTGNITLPHVPEWADPVWHVFPVLVKDREKKQKILKESGINTLIHYPIPPHLSEAYRDLNFKKGEFPITEKIADEIISLPMGPHMNEDQVQYIAEIMCSIT